MDFYSYPKYYLYVYPGWLKSLMDTGKADNYDGRKFKLFEASCGDEKTSYANGHIPGSIHINTDDFEEAPLWNRLSDGRLKTAMEEYGMLKMSGFLMEGSTHRKTQDSLYQPKARQKKRSKISVRMFPHAKT